MKLPIPSTVRFVWRVRIDCYGSMSNVQKHSETVFTHDTVTITLNIPGLVSYVRNFVDAFQHLPMHWDALMLHMHHDALQ